MTIPAETEQVYTWLAQLHKGAAWAYWWTLPERQSRWWKVGSRTAPPGGQRDVYVGVHGCTQVPNTNRKGKPAQSTAVRAQLGYIAALNCLFAEFDAKRFEGGKDAALAHVESLEPRPSAVVDSGGGYHCYWYLTDSYCLETEAARETARRVQAAWVILVGGDDDSKDLARVLRVPGSLNYKYDPPRRVAWMWLEAERQYAWDTLTALAAPFVETTPQARAETSSNPSAEVQDARVQGILADAIKRVALAPDGHKHQIVLRAARTLGGLPALSDSVIENALMGALGTRPVDPEGARRTIYDGIAYGRKAPWDLTKDRPNWEPRTNGYATNGHSAAPQPTHAQDTAPQDSLPIAYHRTDLGNARRLVDQFGHELRYIHTWQQWLVWDGARWAKDETGEVQRRARLTIARIYHEVADLPDGDARKALAKWAAASEGRRALEAMAALAQAEPGIPVRHEDLNADPYLLGCTNGYIDLRTGALMAHDPAALITKQVGCTFDADAACPVWEGFLVSIFSGDAEVIGFVQRAVGMTLTADVREQVLLFLYGTGSNGKSTFIELLMALLGDYAMKAPTEMLMAKPTGGGIPNDVAKLPGVRMVVTAETEEGRRLNESLVKDLTGGDTMSARFMRGEWFEFKPTHTIWMYGNHKPVIRGTDTGIWRRIRLVPFTITIPDAQKDLDLAQKLRAELPGILAWAVRGCLAWQRDGLGVPAAVSAATSAYRAEMDALGTFLDECCVFAPTAHVVATDLYKAFVAWADSAGEHKYSMKRFGMLLNERGIDTYKDATGRIQRLGLGLRSPHGGSPNDTPPAPGDPEPEIRSIPGGSEDLERFSKSTYREKFSGGYIQNTPISSDPPKILRNTESPAPDLSDGLWSAYDRRLVDEALTLHQAGKADKARQKRDQIRAKAPREWLDAQMEKLT